LFMKREEIEERMDELGRKFDQTRDKKIAEEIYKLTKQLEELEKMEKE